MNMELIKAVRERIQDGRMLWDAKRPEGAFLMGLIALSGLSRIRYPGKTPYAVYFERLRECHPAQLEKTAQSERLRAEQLKKTAKSKRAGNKTSPLLQDGEAFKCIVMDLTGDIIMPGAPSSRQPRKNVAFEFGPKLKKTNFEDIMYHDLRCVFVHQGILTTKFKLGAPMFGGLKIHLSHPMEVTGNFVLNVLNAVANSPEIRA